MAADLVNAATSEKLAEVDWMKNIEICEIISRDQRLAKDVTKAIKKRLESKNSNTQLYAVMLLETLMNNIGEHVHKQVIDVGILPILVKIVKKKAELPVRERIFLLLDATQTSLGGASGKFPQYYSAYYDLVSAGVQFPQRPSAAVSNFPCSTPQAHGIDLSNGEPLVSESVSDNNNAKPPVLPELSIIQKASNAAEVLNEVLDAVDPQNPERGKDEFTLDLVEQCSFQKQRVMHLVLTSRVSFDLFPPFCIIYAFYTCLDYFEFVWYAERDEKVVSQAIDLNERLEKVLARHDILLSEKCGSTQNHFNHKKPSGSAAIANYNNGEEAEDEEEAEQLFRRLRKGKACATEREEDASSKRIHMGLVGLSIAGERATRAIIRPILDVPAPESDARSSLPVTLPPPPAKYVEREKFFQDKKVDGSAVAGHSRGPSGHSHDTSRSGSGSIEFNE